jgi:hypothetical protein
MTKVLSLRVADDLAEWADVYAKQRGVTRQALLEEGLRSFQEDCENGVPEIRAAVKRQVGQADEAAGVGDCPKRGPLLGHIWKSRQEDPDKACKFCGLKGRQEAVKGETNESYLSRFTAERTEVFSRLDTRPAMTFGTGKPRELTPEQQARAAAIVEDKKRRDAEAVASGSARPGQVAGVKGQR